jgi:hypothetical protein
MSASRFCCVSQCWMAVVNADNGQRRCGARGGAAEAAATLAVVVVQIDKLVLQSLPQGLKNGCRA